MNRSKGLLSFFAKCSLLVVAVLGVDESLWRALGFQPSSRDEAGLWSSLRRAVDGSPANVALVGSSRLHHGMDSEVLHRLLPDHRFFQLAVDGSDPRPVLEDLALDENFTGTAIVELPVSWVLSPYQPGGQAVDHFLTYRRNEQIGSRIESSLRVACESSLALFHPEAKPWLVLGQLMREGRIHPPATNMDSRRVLRRDFNGVNLKEAEETWLDLFHRSKERNVALETADTPLLLASWAERIRRRGGKVIFFRMNVSGRLLQLEEKDWPHDKYWDVFARSQTSPVLDFADFPELAAFRCPEGSHLDGRDVTPYSEAFARVLRQQKLL